MIESFSCLVAVMQILRARELKFDSMRDAKFGARSTAAWAL
jgi:hypothetical protein